MRVTDAFAGRRKYWRRKEPAIPTYFVGGRRDHLGSKWRGDAAMRKPFRGDAASFIQHPPWRTSRRPVSRSVIVSMSIVLTKPERRRPVDGRVGGVRLLGEAPGDAMTPRQKNRTAVTIKTVAADAGVSVTAVRAARCLWRQRDARQGAGVDRKSSAIVTCCRARDAQNGIPTRWLHSARHHKPVLHRYRLGRETLL